MCAKLRAIRAFLVTMGLTASGVSFASGVECGIRMQQSWQSNLPPGAPMAPCPIRRTARCLPEARSGRQRESRCKMR